MNLNVSGIYQIKNLVNNKIYIGSAANVKNRWKTHKSELNHNKHHSPYLQRAWDKYGIENFEFSILEVVLDINDLIIREQYWMDITECYDSKVGYNLSKIAGSRLGVKASDETIEKLRETLWGNQRGLGYRHTDVEKEKMKKHWEENLTDDLKKIRSHNMTGSNNHKARLNEGQVKEIRRLLKEGNLRDIDIANLFGITRHMVYSIKIYKTWKHVS